MYIEYGAYLYRGTLVSAQEVARLKSIKGNNELLVPQ
jgi:hypothetical protein